MAVTDVFNLRDADVKGSVLLGNLLFTLTLFLVVLYVLQVPQEIQVARKGQMALKELRRISHPLLSIKAVISQFQIDGNVNSAKSELERLGKKAELSIQRYKQAADYNEPLIKNVVDLTAAYRMWLDAENESLDQYSISHDIQGHHYNDHVLMTNLYESNAKLLVAMALLSEGEPALHADIDKGQKAYKILLWASGLLLVYIFTVLFLFLRNSNRQHVIREKNLEMTLRSIGEAVIATDIHGCVTCMNPEAERLTGWHFKDAKGYMLSDVFKVVNAHSGVPINDLVERVRTEKGIVVLAEDSMLIASNGNRYQIYENGAPIYDDANEIIGVVLVFMDITQEHELKNCLNENALRLQRVVDTSMDAVIVIDEQGMVKEWNPAAEKIFGWSYAEIRELPLHDLIIPKEFRQRHLQGIQKLIKNDETSFTSKRIETLALHRDGHTFPIDLAMTSIKTENGWVFNAFIRDLSDHKNNEKLIKKHNVILRETQRIAKLGYWEFDLVNGVLEWSDEIFRMLDLDPATSRPSYGLFINKVHPEDRERVDAAFGESLKSKLPYNIIHRIVSDKGIRIVHEHGDTSYDDDGEPVRSRGMVQDITERVDNLDELRLAATMFRTHAGILITDKNGTIVRVNPAFEEMTGYSSKELVGKNPRIFQSGKQSKEFYEVMKSKLLATGVWQGELWNKRKDGTLFAEWLTITEVKDEAGEVTNYVGTSQDVTERKHAETQIEHLAYHDDLTGLANRRLLVDRLQQNIVTGKRNNEFGAVLILDLDRFKDLNDSLGHSVGDDVLRGVASRLKEIVREGDTVARLGGDEFVVVLSSVGKDLSKIGLDVQAIAEKIRSSLSQPYKLKDGQCFSNASIGISLFPENSGDIEDILKHADTALYRAKAQGRNAVCFYQPSMQAEVDERLAISDGLRDAIENNEFVLYYQPQVNDCGELLGAEALIRWQHPEQGVISPNQFIPVAEDTGLILEIGQWVLQEATRQVAEWQSAGICKKQSLRLAVNVSPRQFAQKDFVAQTLSVFKDAGVSPDCIELEVTESMLMHDLDDVSHKMQELRSHGIRISIDDFGTGYSSLAYLKKLPLDQLKIDQSFICDITTDDNDAVVVETIIAMARHLGLSVIAEGVENQGQFDFLIEKGCNAFQGYYFYRPLNAEDFAVFIREQSEVYLSNQA